MSSDNPNEPLNSGKPDDGPVPSLRPARKRRRQRKRSIQGRDIRFLSALEHDFCMWYAACCGNRGAASAAVRTAFADYESRSVEDVAEHAARLLADPVIIDRIREVSAEFAVGLSRLTSVRDIEQRRAAIEFARRDVKAKLDDGSFDLAEADELMLLGIDSITFERDVKTATHSLPNRFAAMKTMDVHFGQHGGINSAIDADFEFACELAFGSAISGGAVS